jgi:Fe-Mn family superoxide dismutase
MHEQNSFRQLGEKVAAEAEVYKIQLPVSESKLVPVFSKETMSLHYGTLYGNYVKKALAGEGEFQFAGAKLHTLFFEQFQAPETPNTPIGPSKEFVDKHFGSFSNLKDEVKTAALGIQGAGWVYISTTGKVKTIKNHELRSDILILIDMWEHSYIVDYGADKEEYLKGVWKIVNWKIIDARLK